MRIAFIATFVACALCTVSAFNIGQPRGVVTPTVKSDARVDGAVSPRADEFKRAWGVVGGMVGGFSAGGVGAAIAAAEADGYEYGAVDAPISIAWGVGVLAILTSFLPLALQGGEEALDEMRENEKYSFGKSKDILKGRGKRR